MEKNEGRLGEVERVKCLDGKYEHFFWVKIYVLMVNLGNLMDYFLNTSHI